MAPQASDLTGQRFGKWIVLGLSHRGEYGIYYWRCRCDCGTEAVVRGSAMRQEKSGGCLRCNSVRTTHGHTKGGKLPAEYCIWSSMKDRCSNPANQSFADYGGRGITVCERWQGRDGFANFLADMGRRPKGMSLERKENNKGYCPENCCWATRAEQNRNRRNTRLLSCDGRTMCSKDWAREIEIEYRAFHYFLKAGWTLRRIEGHYAVVSPSESRYWVSTN